MVVTAFGSTCVLLYMMWYSRISFIYLFIPRRSLRSRAVRAQRRHSRWSFRRLFCEPIPSITRQKNLLRGPGNDFNIFLFYSTIYSLHLLYNFYCSNMWLWAACESIKPSFLLPFRILSPSRDFSLLRLQTGEEDKRNEKKCWQRQNSTHL